MRWILPSADDISGVATDLLGFDRVMVECHFEDLNRIGCIAFR